MIMITNFLFNFTNFCVVNIFLLRLLTSGILFSTTVNAVFVAKPLISGILPSISVIFFFFFLQDQLHQEFFSGSDLSLLYLVFKTNPLGAILFTFSTIFIIRNFFNNIIFYCIT